MPPVDCASMETAIGRLPRISSGGQQVVGRMRRSYLGLEYSCPEDKCTDFGRVRDARELQCCSQRTTVRELPRDPEA
eukprot:4504872-Pyramimonas_sp.AAC.1